MSTTTVTPADMSLVSVVEEASFTGDLGPVSYCDDGGAPCMINDEFCPMSELLLEHQRHVAQLKAKLEDSEQRVRHLDGLAKLGELSAVVAHEIRNPLAGISATAEVLLDDISIDDPRHESVTIIFQEIQRLEKTVRNLLDFARDHKPFITCTDIREVIERVLAGVDHLAAERGVTVSGACPNDLGDAQADPELLTQAFANLALNAVQAMPHGGELSVKLYRETDQHGRWVRVVVSDSGCGINSENIDRIFDPFFTTKTNGAGLGLAVSKKIIEAQKGRITVHSKPGRGTTFVVSLPAA
ncbi:MAG: sensor histidine kinase [Planctomycetes bacterium]|nr:sensor histidine kinase [Planctomycetota bacterium]